MLLPKVNTAQPKQHRQRRADLICRSVAAKQIADRSPGHSGGAAPERRENVVGNGIADALAKRMVEIETKRRVWELAHSVAGVGYLAEVNKGNNPPYGSLWDAIIDAFTLVGVDIRERLMVHATLAAQGELLHAFEGDAQTENP